MQDQIVFLQDHRVLKGHKPEDIKINFSPRSTVAIDYTPGMNPNLPSIHFP